MSRSPYTDIKRTCTNRLQWGVILHTCLWPGEQRQAPSCGAYNSQINPLLATLFLPLALRVPHKTRGDWFCEWLPTGGFFLFFSFFLVINLRLSVQASGSSLQSPSLSSPLREHQRVAHRPRPGDTSVQVMFTHTLRAMFLSEPSPTHRERSWWQSLSSHN